MLGSNAQRVRKALTEVGSGCAAGPRVPWGQLHPVRAAEPLGPSVPPCPQLLVPGAMGSRQGFVPLALSCCLGSVLLHHQKAPDGCRDFIMESKVWGKTQSCVEGRVNLLCPGIKRCGREKHELPALPRPRVTAVLGSLPVCLPVCPPVQLSVRLPSCLPVCLSSGRCQSHRAVLS